MPKKAAIIPRYRVRYGSMNGYIYDRKLRMTAGFFHSPQLAKQIVKLLNAKEKAGSSR